MEDESLIDELPPEVEINYLELEERMTPSSSLARFIRPFWTAPDKDLSWSMRAAVAAGELHDRRPFQAFLTSGPPFSTFKAGLALKKKLDILWVLDFRDGWVGNPIFRKKADILINLRNRLIENKAVARSDLSIFATGPLWRFYADRYHDYSSKMAIITNGYDARDLVGLATGSRNDGILHLLHSGGIGAWRTARHFIGGVLRAIDEDESLGKRLRVTFLGTFGEDASYWSAKLGDVFKFEPLIPYRQALARMAEADVLLLILNPAGGGKTIMSGKIFEYLALGRPILAVSHPCAATDMIKRLEAGYITNHDDEEEIKNGIIDVYRDWRSGNLGTAVKRKDLAKFERKCLTGLLSDHLNRLVVWDRPGKKRPPGGARRPC